MDKDFYKELSQQAADGNAKAFSRLYEMLYRDMYYTAYYTLANDKDAIEAVIGAARDGFNSISKLRTEEAFTVFMMKTLCARIKMRCKEYLPTDKLSKSEPKLKRRLFKLGATDRLIAVMHIVARMKVPAISAYTGMMKGNVKKRLAGALSQLGLD